MKKNPQILLRRLNFFLFSSFFLLEILNTNVANGRDYFYDPCPEGSYQVPLFGHKRFKSEEHAQLAREGTGLIRGLGSIRPVLASYLSNDDLIMCFSGIVLNRRQVGHHEIFGQYQTYHKSDPGKVVSFIPVLFNAASVQGLHGIKDVNEESPHIFEDPHIFSDPQLVRAMYKELLSDADFSQEMDFPHFSLGLLREKIRKTIDPSINNILTMPGRENEDEQRVGEEEGFTNHIFIMRIAGQHREDTDVHYYLASWVKELAKGEDFPPVGLHTMLIRYHFSSGTLAFHKFENARNSVRIPLIEIPRRSGYVNL